MGCCGCSNEASATTAAIFGLVQGGIGMILNAYFINLYTDYVPNLRYVTNDSLFLLFATRHQQYAINIILSAALILHISWIVSSVILLIGNSKNSSCCVRQWVVVTSFIIIGDILLPIVLIAATISSFNVVLYEMEKAYESNSFNSGFGQFNPAPIEPSITLNFYTYYIILIASFTKFGLISIIVNICLNIFTHNRAREIDSPRGHVIAAPPVNIGMYPQGFAQPQGPVFVQPQGQGFVQFQ